MLLTRTTLHRVLNYDVRQHQHVSQIQPNFSHGAFRLAAMGGVGAFDKPGTLRDLSANRKTEPLFSRVALS